MMRACIPLGHAAALAARGTVTAILFDWDDQRNAGAGALSEGPG
jgi:hypothetical protein